jgi:uncharacterized protein YcbK (DUF882 family)
MKITANFSMGEFNTRNAILTDSVKANIITLAKNLQVLRDEVKRPITISSGYRSPQHNASVGGAKNSRHILGDAADIKVQGMTPRQVADVIELLIKDGRMLEGGLGVYRTWVHYDTRGTKARWVK